MNISKLIIIALSLLSLASCNSDESNVLGSGSFEATEVLVSSEVNGKVLTWKIKEGDNLTEGEEVGLVDTTQLYLKREALLKSGTGVRAARPNISTQTEALEVQLRDLREQKGRTERLLKGGVATQRQMDDVNTAIASLESQLAATRSTLQNSSAQISAQSSAIDVQIKQVDDLIRRSIIRSPINGTVTASYINQGELAGAGRPLFRVADLEEMHLRAYISANNLSKIKVGDKVLVYVDGIEADKRQYQGTITWIASEAEFTPKSVQTEEERSNLVYAVKIRVQNDGYLRMGMYGEVGLPL
mgnify:CR=1 FL=1